jgi:hypothetical protein
VKTFSTIVNSITEHPSKALIPKAGSRLEKVLFLVVLLLNLAIYVFLIADQRMVRGHDTFLYYSLQYYVMANATATGEAALWMPHLTQGTSSSLLLGLQGGLLQNILTPIGQLFDGTNFLILFYLGVLLDELLLLVGVWLLARRYYTSPYTMFFVAVAAVGSCMWIDQFSFNLHSYYAAPIIIYLIHEFLEQGSRLKIFLASNLLLLHTMGNPPYMPLLTCLVILFYFAGYFVIFGSSAWKGALKGGFKKTDLVWGLLIVMSVASIFGTVVAGTSQITDYTPQRQADGSTTLDVFLTYGGALNPVRYLDFLLGLSPTLDYTIFCGFFTIAFAILAVFYNPTRKVLHLTTTLLLILFFSMGTLTILAMIVYYLIPVMSFYRHVALSAPYVKLFVVFLSGYGFEAIMVKRWHEKLPIVSVAVVMLMVAATLTRLVVSAIFGNTEFLEFVMTLLEADSALTKFPDFMGLAVFTNLLVSSALAAGLVGVVLLLRSLGIRFAPLALGLILLLHPLELFSWKFRMFDTRSVRLEGEEYSLQKLQPLPYVPRRSWDYEANKRFNAFSDSLFAGAIENQPRYYGAMYWTADAFLFMDAPSSLFRAGHWMFPLDDLMRAYWGQPLRDNSVPPAGLSFAGPLYFPVTHPATGKVIGATLDKIQVFSTAHPVVSDRVIAALITDQEYGGDMLFLSSQDDDQEPAPSSLRIPLQTNERLAVPYEVLRFDANTLELRVTLPEGRSQAWLLYCDVWDPNWEATVNENAVEVRKANLAYKAVPLVAGENIVKFRFNSLLRRISFGLVSLSSLMWAGLVMGWIFGFAVSREPLSQQSTKRGDP